MNDTVSPNQTDVTNTASCRCVASLGPDTCINSSPGHYPVVDANTSESVTPVTLRPPNVEGGNMIPYADLDILVNYTSGEQDSTGGSPKPASADDLYQVPFGLEQRRDTEVKEVIAFGEWIVA